MKHIEQYTDVVTISVGQNTKPIEIVECSDGDFLDEELLIVVQDKDLKFKRNNPPVMSSTGLEVYFAPNAVAAERQEADEESVVDTLEREDNVLSDTLSPATHVRLDADYGRPIPDTTQQMMILSDEDFDDVVRADLKLIKQAWADMATETFYHCNFANNSGATKQKKACILETLSSASLRLREPPSASFIARMAPKRRRFEPTPAADHPSHSAPAPTDEPTPATSHHVPPHPEARLSINDPANKSRKISQKYKSGCI
ncbi:hypothetical protein QL285_025874 [Trifolium repens]|nr:hypothetical protein QL285_025874 [Trifolium repens]